MARALPWRYGPIIDPGDPSNDESAALRKEAAEILSRSRWWADEQARDDAARGATGPDAAIVVTDLAGTVTHWSAEAERLYGWSSADATGRRIADLAVRPEDGDCASEILARVQRDGHCTGDFPLRRKDGSEFTANVRLTVVEDDAGRAIGLVAEARWGRSEAAGSVISP